MDASDNENAFVREELNTIPIVLDDSPESDDALVARPERAFLSISQKPGITGPLFEKWKALTL